jgi:N-acetylglucosamine-6-phosphate deacetylase
MIISGSKIITPLKIIENGIVIVNDGMIEYIGEEEKGDLASSNNVYKGEYIVPGFIDIHVVELTIVAGKIVYRRK